MADIVEEVIRDTREERKANYLKKALPYVLFGTILIVLLMIINDSRKNSARIHNAEMGDTIVNSLETLSNDPNVAIEGIDYVINNSKNSSRELASLHKVAVNLASNNIEVALLELEKIIDNKKYQELTIAYAKLTWLGIIMDNSKISEENEKRMKLYFSDFTKSSPFYSSAKLLQAIHVSKTDGPAAMQIATDLLKHDASNGSVREEALALISNLKFKK